MRRLFKWFLWGLGVLVVIAAIAAAFNWERIQRLMAVNSLFAEDRIVANFSSMKDAFLWKPVELSGEADGWPEAPAPLPDAFVFEGRETALEAWLAETDTTSLLVLRDGAITHESYRLGTGQDDLRISWSVAKSFLSAMFGIAHSQGLVGDLDGLVTDMVPELAGTAYDGVTIRQALTMSTGVKFNEDYLDYDSDINRMGRVLALGGTMDGFAASLMEKAREPGIARQYTSIDTHVLAMVLRKATGKSLPDYFAETIANPLGFRIPPYYLTDGEGVAFALGGLNLTTRDYARLGQVFLDWGLWQGEEIIPAGWVIRSTTVQAPPPVADDGFKYGFQWWIPADARPGEFLARGIYGQFVYVNRPAGTVVVKTSADREFREEGVMEMTLEGFRAIADHTP